MSYYFKRGSKKVMAGTLMAIQNLAQQEADKLGRAVVIYGDEATRAVKKVYKRNPINGYDLIWEDLYGEKSLFYETKAKAEKALKLAKEQGYKKARIRRGTYEPREFRGNYY